MTTTISGTAGVTFPNSSVQAVAATGFGFKNRIINGGFIINQRAYVSGTALASGVYAHDRYKAGSGGCTYTFTQGSLGVNTTITITAGSLQQVIEGCNMPEGGTYVLSWTGSAQARFNGGTYGASPLAVTGITAGANVTIEFNTGTVGSVQLETGVTATSFDVRDYGRELILCQRYYEKGSAWYQATGSASSGGVSNQFSVTKRTTTTNIFSNITYVGGSFALSDFTSSLPAPTGTTGFSFLISPAITGAYTTFSWSSSAEL